MKKRHTPRLTIYDIKRLTATTAPHFFTRQTMRTWSQRLKDFSVIRTDDGRYRISAPVVKWGRYIMHTVRYYNPATHELEKE